MPGVPNYEKGHMGQVGNLSHQIHPKVIMVGSKCLFPDSQKTYIYSKMYRSITDYTNL